MSRTARAVVALVAAAALVGGVASGAQAAPKHLKSPVQKSAPKHL